MKTFIDLIEFMTALNDLADRYAKHKINRDDYLSKFDETCKAYEAIN